MTMDRRHLASAPGWLKPQIKLPDQVIVVQFVRRLAAERDLAVDDDVAGVGDANCLREILFGHQHRELILVLQFTDGVDGAADQHRREADGWLIDPAN